VVELHHAVGDHQRMMVRQRHDARAEPDALRPRRDVGDEELRRRDGLVPGRVMLADPRLVVAELVEPLDQRPVALERERRVLVGRVERGGEDSEAQAFSQHRR
jgi:hypothetical protein